MNSKLFNTESASVRWREHLAKSDLTVALLMPHVWGTLGWHDIRQRYRRSVLGPFWFTLSTLILVTVLGLLYAKLFKQEITIYLPYLGTGLVVWQYIGQCMTEGSSALIDSEYLIKQVRMPLSIHVLRMTWRNFLILLHSLPVIIIFVMVFGYSFNPQMLLLFPALALLFVQGLWIGLALSIICARYRDVLPLVGNLILVFFFFTPVMWMPEVLADRAWIAHLNPLYHLIETVRAPLIGRPILLISWLWSLGLAMLGLSFTRLLLSKTRDRIAYWV